MPSSATPRSVSIDTIRSRFVTGAKADGPSASLSFKPSWIAKGRVISLDMFFSCPISDCWAERGSCRRNFSLQLVKRDQILFDRVDHCLCAMRKAQLSENVADMCFDGLFTDEEGFGDFAICEPAGQAAQHFQLARSEERRVGK